MTFFQVSIHVFPLVLESHIALKVMPFLFSCSFVRSCVCFFVRFFL